MNLQAGIITLFWLLLNCKSLNEDPTIVNTNYGPVQGKYVGNSISFTSIPYAKPPLHELRYANPEPTPSWTDVLETVNDPPGCIQDCLMPWFLCPVKTSEDCLYLNVFKPITSNSSSELLPVMIFIHGGSYLIGYGGGPIYNGTNLAILTNTIVVTINYRLGALGFLYSPSLGLHGNYGFQDQLFAIKWVHDNIKAFGGDSNNIIIYGESAGASSVGLHLMILNQTYVKGAIMESNPASVPLRDPLTWGNIPHLFQDLCDCGNLTGTEALSCLRKTPAEAIAYLEIAALADSFQYISIDGMPWSPTINSEDQLFKDQPVFAYQKGDILDVPIIMGTNLNESALFVYLLFPFKVKPSQYFALLSDVYGEQDAKKIFAFYNISITSDEDVRPIAGRIGTDSGFRCPSHNMTASASVYNKENTVFFYHLDHVSQWNDIFYQEYPQCYDAVCHGNELPYVFDASGTLPLNGSWTTQELQLSQLMQWYWATFAKSHNPSDANGYGNTWEPFNVQSQPTMLFDIGESKIAYNYDKETCDFWDSMGYTWIVS